MNTSKDKKTISKNKKRLFIFFITITVVTVSIIFGVSKYQAKQILDRTVEISDYYKKNYDKDIGEEIVTLYKYNIEEESKSIVKEEGLYLSVEFLKKYIDPYIFYEEELNKVIITDKNTVARYEIGEEKYFLNGKEMELNIPIKNFDDKSYLPENLVKNLYNLDLIELSKYGIVIIEDNKRDKIKGEIIGNKTYLLFDKNKKGKIAFLLEEKEKVEIITQGLSFTKVMNKDGIKGYVQNENIRIEEIIKKKSFKPTELVKQRVIEGKIVLLWDQVFNTVANDLPNRREQHIGVTVLSPTWLTFNEKKLDGELVNIASKDYVDFAHSNGYEVWPLITDIPSGKVDGVGNIASKVLTSSDKREYIIKQLIKYIEIYDFDGINLDFEYIRKDNIDNYIQFMRELYPLMKERGKILSVDVYVPSPWSMYYKRNEMAQTVDYLAVMTYDEHTNGSEISGPVASRKFVEKGVLDMLKEVPKEKILMGIPFYTRVWKFEMKNNDLKRKMSNFGMRTGEEYLTSRGGILEWDEDVGYYYSKVEFIENGKPIIYESWLETIKSIEVKLEIFNESDLAGVALWKRGLEDKKVWELIDREVHK